MAPREQRVSVGVILISPEGVEISYAIRFKFITSNN